MVLQEAAGGPKPALRIVSLHADLTNRGPTFDMDLSELERDGQPISYAEAQQYFKRDPAHRSVCSDSLLTLLFLTRVDSPAHQALLLRYIRHYNVETGNFARPVNHKGLVSKASILPDRSSI